MKSTFSIPLTELSVCLSSHTFKYIIFIKQYKNTTYIVMFNGRENWLNLLKIYIEKKKKIFMQHFPLWFWGEMWPEHFWWDSPIHILQIFKQT